MLPLADESRRPTHLPIATYLIIGLNILVFILEFLGGDQFTLQYAMIPNNVTHGVALITLFTAMFLHAGFEHIFGNMIYLWVFGPNLEDVMGSIPYTIFYLICGLAANAAQILADPTSMVPNLGASGAIAGVLGGFILEFPNDAIRTVGFVGGAYATRVSALVLIGFWFVLQLFSEIGSVTSAQAGGGGGVAFLAHIGGFIVGLVLVKLFARRAPAQLVRG